MSADPPSLFACDAMLGYLVRWLRAAGYDTFWREGIDDSELVRLAQREGRFLLSSDTGIFQYRVVRDGTLPALHVPNGLGKREQLAFVLGRLKLSLREPRCMACGGPLAEVPREEVGDRVPPRSRAWLERFFECSRCGQFFWHGTHWQRIAALLRQAVAASPPSSEEADGG
jgi:uncharacterized protein with PIN domain